MRRGVEERVNRIVGIWAVRHLPQLDKLISAPVMLSGRTARPAGRTYCGREERCDAPPCSEGGECRHG